MLAEIISAAPSKQTVMVLLLLCAMLVVVRSLLKKSGDTKSDIDLDDLILEWDERAGRMRVSILRVGFIMTWCLCAWIMVYLTLGGKMTEGYMGLFGGLWVAPIVSAIIWGKRLPPPPAGPTTIVTGGKTTVEQ